MEAGFRPLVRRSTLDVLNQQQVGTLAYYASLRPVESIYNHALLF